MGYKTVSFKRFLLLSSSSLSLEKRQKKFSTSSVYFMPHPPVRRSRDLSLITETNFNYYFAVDNRVNIGEIKQCTVNISDRIVDQVLDILRYYGTVYGENRGYNSAPDRSPTNS